MSGNEMMHISSSFKYHERGIKRSFKVAKSSALIYASLTCSILNFRSILDWGPNTTMKSVFYYCMILERNLLETYKH